MSRWWERHSAGLVRNDPNLLVLRPAAGAVEQFTWGTVFYSKAREDYKTQVSNLPPERAATFDVELMARLQIGRAGDLLIAANPNSIVPGHLVVYPEEKREDLTFEDLRDMSRLAQEQQAWTFIHNMDRAAASIVDWAHFQAYPWEFPMEHEMGEAIYETSSFKPGSSRMSPGGHRVWSGRLSRLSETYPAYVLKVECESAEDLALWLSEMLGALASRKAIGIGRRIPCNIVWRGARAWLIPRSSSQSLLAATYVGALEMGGLFCLPNADHLRQYLPDALREEVRQAGVAGEPQMREWCEQTAREIAGKLSSGDR
jgi:hypothetical protein